MNMEHWIAAGVLILTAGISLHFILFPQKNSADVAKHMQWQMKIMGFNSTIQATPASYKIFRWWGILMLALSVYLTFYLVLDVYNTHVFCQTHRCGHSLG